MQTTISLLFILFCASIASAASFVITTNGDTHDASTADGVCADSGGNCTLRAAVEQSGATTSDDAITFAGGLSTIILTLNSEIAVNKSGALQITANSLVSIERSQATGTPEHRIFNIALTARVTMTNLKISFGQTPVGDFTGGGIKNSGSLILTASTVSGNLAGITTFSSDLRISYGGGIYNNGSLTLENCVVENNRASHVSGFGGGGGTGNYCAKHFSISKEFLH